jgi:hypothetical protein
MTGCNTTDRNPAIVPPLPICMKYAQAININILNIAAGKTLHKYEMA